MYVGDDLQNPDGPTDPGNQPGAFQNGPQTAFQGGATNLTADEVRSYFATLLHTNPTAGQLAQYTGMPRDQAYSQLVAMQTPDPNRIGDGSGQTSTAPPGGGPNNGPPGGGLSSVGSLIQPFTGSFTPPSQINLGGPQGIPYIPPTPQFTPPSYTPPPAFSYQDFKAPSAQDVLSDPGYQFRLGQGEQALQASAAGRGVLNTGGTLKDVLDYGQNYASQEYGNVYDRSANQYATNRGNAVQNYMQNYQTQYVDPYQIQFQGAQAAFAPQMAGYQTQAAAGQRQNENDYSNAFAQYQQMYKEYQDAQNLLYNYRAPLLNS